MNSSCAMEWKEFLASGFNGRPYSFPDFDGDVVGEIACKRWNRSRNLLTYIDLDDGRKIVTGAWNTNNFCGLADMPVGTRVRLSFRFSKNGNAYLFHAETI